MSGPAIDWGDGDYARTAATLMPVAGVVVAAAEVSAGRRVLDVACGTGNAAALAVARGAAVVAIDAAPGLAELARARLAGEPTCGWVTRRTCRSTTRRSTWR